MTLVADNNQNLPLTQVSVLCCCDAVANTVAWTRHHLWSWIENNSYMFVCVCVGVLAIFAKKLYRLFSVGRGFQRHSFVSSAPSTPKVKRCVHLPLEFVLFFVKVKYLKEIVDSRVVQSGKYVCEDVHREQTDHTVRKENEGVVWETGTVKKSY